MPGMSGYEGCELSVEQLALLLLQDLKVALKKFWEKKHEGHIILALYVLTYLNLTFNNVKFTFKCPKDQ